MDLVSEDIPQPNPGSEQTRSITAAKTSSLPSIAILSSRRFCFYFGICTKWHGVWGLDGWRWRWAECDVDLIMQVKPKTSQRQAEACNLKQALGESGGC